MTQGENPKDAVASAKPNLSIVPFAPLLEVCGALYEGALKYGPWNWRDTKVKETIYVDAAIRHLMQFLSGEDIDPDSGIHHVSKAIAGLVILRDAQIHGCSVDDRRAAQDLQIPQVTKQMAEVLERYGDTEKEAEPETVEFSAKVLARIRQRAAREAARQVAPVPTPPIKITKAGGGDGVLTPEHVGHLVALREGSTAKIFDYNDRSDRHQWPFSVRHENGLGVFTVDENGCQSGMDTDRLNVPQPLDVVRILD